MEKYFYSDGIDKMATFENMVADASEKVFPLTEEKFDAYVIGKGYYGISKGMAKEFYRDLCGTIYGSSSTNSRGTMNTKAIARYMNITETKANAFLYSCAEYKITEKQNGSWVV